MPSTIRTILVVDNNSALTSFFNDVLTNHGYSVRIASTGMEALASVREDVPDLAIVDRVMPEMDGDELCRLLRSDERTRSMFLVVVSAIAVEDPAPPEGCRLDAYLAKAPFGELKDTILEVIADLAAGNAQKYAGRLLGADSLHERQITSELLESKRHLEAFLEATPNGVIELNRDNIVVRANRRAKELVGIDDGPLVSRDLTSVLSAAVPPERLREVLNGAETEFRSLGMDGPISLNGRYLVLSIRAIESPQSPATLVLVRDVTELHESRLQVERLLDEKQQLLREVQHRVKNSLTLISSLLGLAAGRTESTEAREALAESNSRVRSVLRMHETLNQAGHYQTIDVIEFLRVLCSDAQSLYPSSDCRLTCRFPAEAIGLPVRTALPLGLMLNELVTNAFKYAVPEDSEERTEISVQLEHDGDSLCIQVSDNGPGLPEGTPGGPHDGLGLQIVAAQAEQIGATFTADTEKSGAVLLIRLPVPG